MNEPRQAQFLKIGEEGCYFDAIIHLAEDETGTYIDDYQTYLWSLSSRVIEENCYVNKPDALMSRLAGGSWTVEKRELTAPIKSGECVITRYERKVSPTVTKSHFVVTKGMKVVYDGMGSSDTVKYGEPVSLRVFTRIS